MFICNICGVKFSQNSNLRRHMNCHDERKSFDCGVCSKKFKTKRYLHEHTKVHKERDLYQCDFCERSFKNMTGKKLHVDFIHQNITYNCPKCHETFSRDSYSKSHFEKCIKKAQSEAISDKEDMFIVKDVSKENLNTDIDDSEQNVKLYPKIDIKLDRSGAKDDQYYLFTEDEVGYNIGKLDPTNEISEERIDLELIIPRLVRYKDNKNDVFAIFDQIEKLVFLGKNIVQEYVKETDSSEESSSIETSYAKESMETTNPSTNDIIDETNVKRIKSDPLLIKEHGVKDTKEEIAENNFGNYNNPQEVTLQVQPCNGCSKLFSKKSNLKRHMKTCIKTDSKEISLFNDNDHKEIACKTQILICKDCEKSFATKSTLNKHIRVIHIEGNIKKSIDKGKTIPCTVCNRLFSKRNNLRRHLKSFHGYKFVAGRRLTDYETKEIQKTGIRACSKCGKEFPFVTRLEKHRFWKHVRGLSASLDCAATQKQKIQLCKCDKIFKNDNEKSRHMKLEHLGYIPCPKCRRCIQGTDNLEIHLKNHDKTDIIDREMVCEQCGKSSKNLTRHRYHIKMYHPKSPSICDICQQTFRNEMQLSWHKESIHQEVSPYQCDVCSKMCKSSRRLRTHKKYVHAERNYQCDKCEKKFIDEYKMKKHEVNVHLKTRPYACRYNCGGMAYNDSSNRNCHEKKKHGAIFPTQPPNLILEERQNSQSKSPMKLEYDKPQNN